MNNRRLSIYMFLMLFFLLAGSCAKISSPTGGPRDRKPPVALSSSPAPGTVNFSGNRIEIGFDEFVTLDNINDKFMVSPPFKKKPRVYMRGKNVIVDFEEPLRDNTTYTCYFQDAIRDLNEANVLENYQFVFSTGPVVDSLSVTGNVYKADNLEAPEKTLVMLYSSLHDTTVSRQAPDYITRVDRFGYFRIDNIREGRYRLYALTDEDNSRTYNNPDEAFAYADTLINVTPAHNWLPLVPDTVKTVDAKAKAAAPRPSSGEHKLYLFKARPKTYYLKSASRPSAYLLEYILSLPPDTAAFSVDIPGAAAGTFMNEYSAGRDTLKVWLTDSSAYNRPLIQTLVTYPFTDSTGTEVQRQDTAALRFTAPRTTRNVRPRKPSYNLESNLSVPALKPGHKILFRSQTPFRAPDTSRLKLFELTGSERKRMNFEMDNDLLVKKRIVLTATLAPLKNYLLTADSAAFGNIYGGSNDSLGYRFTVRDPESFSRLTINQFNGRGQRIIQLLDKTEKIMASQITSKDGKIVFPLLDPGTFRLRVIYDTDGDGKWSTGDFTDKRQPESVSYYPTEIELKQGFYLEQDWDLLKVNFKENILRTFKQK